MGVMSTATSYVFLNLSSELHDAGGFLEMCPSNSQELLSMNFSTVCPKSINQFNVIPC